MEKATTSVLPLLPQPRSFVWHQLAESERRTINQTEDKIFKNRKQTVREGSLNKGSPLCV